MINYLGGTNSFYKLIRICDYRYKLNSLIIQRPHNIFESFFVVTVLHKNYGYSNNYVNGYTVIAFTKPLPIGRAPLAVKGLMVTIVTMQSHGM